MSARLLELHAETNNPEPYEITDQLVVTPPTRTRVKAMNTAEMKLYFSQQVLNEALSRASVPRPVLADGATDDQRLAHAQAVGEWTAGRITDEELAAIGEQVSAAEAEYERAFFGDVYDDLIEFFEDKPGLWAKFVPDIKTAFGPKAPEDGVCPSCGKVVDEESAGKAPESST